ncbi:MAG: hydrogenase maturation protease [Actinobacteria bacterium]|nr:hydrogenase maturation protease [Actinomycetota bacterium]
MTTCVVGVGNALRGDDAAGLVVVQLLEADPPDGVRLMTCEGEPLSLLSSWGTCDTVYVVDATNSGIAAGTVRRFEADAAPLPDDLNHSSTHLLGVAEAIELGRTLGKLPPRTVLYAIEGAAFDTGGPLSLEVAAAVEQVAAAIREELA